MTRGEPRLVQPRRPRCRFLPPRRAFPTAIPTRLRCLPALHLRSKAAIDERAGRRTERRTGHDPRETIDVSRRTHAFSRAHADDVPLLGALRASAVAGADDGQGRSPAAAGQTDRDPPSWRRPAKGAVVRWAGMPSPVTSAAGPGGSLPRDARAGPPPTPPSAPLARRASRALQAPWCGHPRTTTFGRTSAFSTPRTRLGLTTQARR